MIQNDYLMRQLQQLGNLFAHLVAGKHTLPPEVAIRQIEDGLAEFLNKRREFLFSDGPDFIDEMDPRACAELGRLLVVHARLSAQVGRPSDADRSLAWATRALVRALTQPGSNSGVQAEGSLLSLLRDPIAETLEASQVGRLYEALFDFAVESKRYPQAEDSFFARMDVEADSAFLKRGLAYFQSLLTVDVASLQDQGVSLEEVQALVAEVEMLDLGIAS